VYQVNEKKGRRLLPHHDSFNLARADFEKNADQNGN